MRKKIDKLYEHFYSMRWDLARNPLKKGNLRAERACETLFFYTTNSVFKSLWAVLYHTVPGVTEKTKLSSMNGLHCKVQRAVKHSRRHGLNH